MGLIRDAYALNGIAWEHDRSGRWTGSSRCLRGLHRRGVVGMGDRRWAFNLKTRCCLTWQSWIFPRSCLAIMSRLSREIDDFVFWSIYLFQPLSILCLLFDQGDSSLDSSVVEMVTFVQKNHDK